LSEADALIARLSALFAETFHIEAPSANTDLLEDGLLDSLQLVELLAQLEQRFGIQIRIDEVELDDLRTLGRIARMLAANSAAAARPDSARSTPG
jgi:acyl carrier protein